MSVCLLKSALELDQSEPWTSFWISATLNAKFRAYFYIIRLIPQSFCWNVSEQKTKLPSFTPAVSWGALGGMPPTLYISWPECLPPRNQEPAASVQELSLPGILALSRTLMQGMVEGNRISLSTPYSEVPWWSCYWYGLAVENNSAYVKRTLFFHVTWWLLKECFRIRSRVILVFGNCRLSTNLEEVPKLCRSVWKQLYGFLFFTICILKYDQRSILQLLSSTSLFLFNYAHFGSSFMDLIYTIQWNSCCLN